MEDDPPSSIICRASLFVALLVIFTPMWVLGEGRHRQAGSPPVGQYQTIQGNSIKALNMPYVPIIDVLGDLTSDIISCESSGDPYAYNRTSGAKGLLQIIPSSERFCEKLAGRDLDMFDPQDNLLCGEYLYQHGGLEHWQASKGCWER